MGRRERESLHITDAYKADQFSSAGSEPDSVVSSVHHYHHSDTTPPHVSVDMERNSRGVTWGVHVSGAESVAQAMELMDKARNEMEHRFGTVSEVK